MGIRNTYNLRADRRGARTVPVILDAGIGTASDATLALELGCSGVLLGERRVAVPRTLCGWPERCGRRVAAGWLARGAGRIPRRLYAEASTPHRGRAGADVSSDASADAPLEPFAAGSGAVVGGPLARGMGGPARRRAFGECCSVDVFYEDPPGDRAARGGWASWRRTRRSCGWRCRTCASRRWGEAVIDGRNGCIPWRLVGTHRGDVGDIPHTGRFVTLPGVHYIALVDGRVRRGARLSSTSTDAAVQLGMLPKRGSLGESAIMLLRGFGPATGLTARPAIRPSAAPAAPSGRAGGSPPGPRSRSARRRARPR